jgi:hypothetical protein
MRILVALMVVSAVAAAQPKKSRGTGDAPAIELADAVAQARGYATQHKIDLRSQYLQSAIFNARTREWNVGWQMPNAKGGYTEIHVPESGPITVSYGE